MEEIIIIKQAAPKKWVREIIDPRSWVRRMGEGLIGDYREKMEKLRETDDQIQDWAEDLTRLIFNINREMQNALKSNRFIDLAILLNSLNNRLKNIIAAGKQVEQISEEAIGEFELEHELPLEKMDSDDGLTSEAGFISDLKRQWVAKKFENKERAARNLALQHLLTTAKTTINRVNNYLEKMRIARTYGNIGDYIQHLKGIEKEQQIFQKAFQIVYNKYLKSFVDKALARQEEQEIKKQIEQKPIEIKEPKEEIPELETPKIEPIVEEPEEIRDTLPEAPIPTAFETQKQEVKSKEKKKPATKKTPASESFKLPTQEEKDKLEKSIEKSFQAQKEEREKTKKQSSNAEISLTKYNNLKFLGELIKTAKRDDPYLIVAMLLKYAEQIDEEQPNESIYLTEIAQSMLQ